MTCPPSKGTVCQSVWAVPFILCINILFSLHGNTGEGPHPCCPSPRHSSNHSSIMHLMKGYQGEPFLKHSGKTTTTTTTHKGHNVSEGEVRRLLSVRGHSVVEVPPSPGLLSAPGWPQWCSSMWQTTEAHVRNKVILCHGVVSSCTESCVAHEMVAWWIAAPLWQRVESVHHIFFL